MSQRPHARVVGCSCLEPLDHVGECRRRENHVIVLAVLALLPMHPYRADRALASRLVASLVKDGFLEGKRLVALRRDRARTLAFEDRDEPLAVVRLDPDVAGQRPFVRLDGAGERDALATEDTRDIPLNALAKAAIPAIDFAALGHSVVTSMSSGSPASSSSSAAASAALRSGFPRPMPLRRIPAMTRPRAFASSRQ